MNELLIAKKWLRATLAADAQLTELVGGATAPRIYDSAADDGAAYPFVVFQLRNPNDLAALGARRVAVNVDVLVKGVHRTQDYGPPLSAIDARIDAVLQGAEGEVAGAGYVLACERQQPFEMPETAEAGAEYRHLGGEYHLLVQRNEDL